VSHPEKWKSLRKLRDGRVSRPYPQRIRLKKNPKEVLRLPLTGGFIAHSHNEGINGNIPGPEGFKRANPQRSKGIKSKTLRGGCAQPWD